MKSTRRLLAAILLALSLFSINHTIELATPIRQKKEASPPAERKLDDEWVKWILQGLGYVVEAVVWLADKLEPIFSFIWKVIVVVGKGLWFIGKGIWFGLKAIGRFLDVRNTKHSLNPWYRPPPISTGNVVADAVVDVAAITYHENHHNGISGCYRPHNLSPNPQVEDPKKKKKKHPEDGENEEDYNQTQGRSARDRALMERALTNGKTAQDIPEEVWQNFTPEQLKKHNAQEDKKLIKVLEAEWDEVKKLKSVLAKKMKNKNPTPEETEQILELKRKIALAVGEMKIKIRERTKERIRSVLSIGLRKFNQKLQDIFDLKDDPIKRIKLDKAYEKMKSPDEQTQDEAAEEIMTLYQDVMTADQKQVSQMMSKILGDELSACGLTAKDAKNPFTLQLIKVFTMLLVKAKMAKIRVKMNKIRAEAANNLLAKSILEDVAQINEDEKKIEKLNFQYHDPSEKILDQHANDLEGEGGEGEGEI